MIFAFIAFILALLLLVVPPIYEALNSKYVLNRVRVGNQVPDDIAEEMSEEGWGDEYIIIYKPLDN